MPKASAPTAVRYILLIEDNPGDVQLLTEAFVCNHSLVAIHAVSTVREAVHWLRGEGPPVSRFPPALIVLDLILPGAPGMAALVRLKATDAWRRIPVVVLSASSREEDRSESTACGAAQFLSKPHCFAGYLQCAAELQRAMSSCSCWR